jgi:capsular polysaccharide biosynthesis protein
VANEGEVERLLHEEGFTTVSSGSLSVAEQILLFSQATHVVGAHGAGLANMVFCRPGARVIEFVTDDPHAHWRCYYNLASAMGLQYALVCAGTTASAEASFEERRDADLVVDPDILKQAVTAMND